MEVAGYKKSFAIDQGTVLGMDQLFQALFHQGLNDPKREGICTGLSMIWLARLMTFDKETAEQRLDALHSVGGYRWGGKTQDIHLAAGTGGAPGEEQMSSMFNEALKAYSLKLKPNSFDWMQPGLTNRLNSLVETVKKKHSYRLYNLAMRVNGAAAGHMVASYASGGKMGFNRHLYFFDPNFGEYKIGIDDTAQFLGRWMAAYRAGNMIPTQLVTFAVER